MKLLVADDQIFHYCIRGRLKGFYSFSNSSGFHMCPSCLVKFPSLLFETFTPFGGSFQNEETLRKTFPSVIELEI